MNEIKPEFIKFNRVIKKFTNLVFLTSNNYIIFGYLVCASIILEQS